MREFSNSPFESTLSVVSTLRDGSIRSQVRATREHDELIRVTAQAYSFGVDINALSDASGLTVKEIMDAASRSRAS
jgi:hypothetical protein